MAMKPGRAQARRSKVSRASAPATTSAAGVSRRRLVVGASALGSASLIAACAVGGEPAPGLSAKPVSLELATDWNSAQRKGVLDVMKSEFIRQYPNVTINHQHIDAAGGSAQGLTERIIAQLSAGTAPEIVANWSWVPFVDQLADLTKDAPAAGWKKADVLYNPVQQELNGKLYMLGMSASNSAWIYNKNLFQEAGVKEPDDTWTTDTALDAMRRLTRPDRGQYGFLATSNPWVGWFELMWAAGVGSKGPTNAEVINPERKKMLMGEGAGPDVFEWYANLILRHQVSPTPAQVVAQGATFAAGKIAMQPAGIYNLGGLAAQIKDQFAWSAMWTPKSPGTGKRASHLVTDGFSVLKVAKQRGSHDAAVRYLVSFYSDPVQKLVAEQRATMPVMRKWVESKEYLAAPPFNLDINTKMLNDKQLISGSLNFYHPQFRTWLAALRAETDKVFTGENAPKPGLTAGIAAVERILAAG